MWRDVHVKESLGLSLLFMFALGRSNNYSPRTLRSVQQLNNYKYCTYIHTCSDDYTYILVVQDGWLLRSRPIMCQRIGLSIKINVTVVVNQNLQVY